MERDGILNEVRMARGQPISPLTSTEFQVNAQAEGPLRRLKAAGLLLIVTTNQPALSRGHLARRELDRMHDLLRRAFPLDDILVCPHEEADECPCRKPQPGLLVEAAFKWHLELEQCYVVSDKWQDAETARQTGCTSLLLRSPWIGRGHHDFVLPDLETIAAKIIALRHPTEWARAGVA